MHQKTFYYSLLFYLLCSFFVSPLTDLQQVAKQKPVSIVYKNAAENFSRTSVSFLPVGVPLLGKVSSHFGIRFHPIKRRFILHKGIDLVGSLHSSVRATAQGVVVSAGLRAGYGNCVILDHGHGWQTLYAHLESSSLVVGEKVNAGEKVGVMGATGDVTGPHLHYEVHYNGVAQNPQYFLHQNNQMARR